MGADHEFVELAGRDLTVHLVGVHGIGDEGIPLPGPDLRPALHWQRHNPQAAASAPEVGGGMAVPGVGVPAGEVGRLGDVEAAVDGLRELLAASGLRIVVDPAAAQPPAAYPCPACGTPLWVVVDTAEVEQLHRLRRQLGGAVAAYHEQAARLLLRAFPVTAEQDEVSG